MRDTEIERLPKLIKRSIPEEVHTLCFALVLEAVKPQQRSESIDPAPSGRIYQSDNQTKWSKKYLSNLLSSQIATKEAAVTLPGIGYF